MRNRALTGSAMLGFLVLGAGAVLGQNYNAADAVSLSRYGTMSCAQFTHLGQSAQDNIVRKMARAAPPMSLSTPMPPKIDPDTGEVPSASGSPSAVPGTPLTAGQLIAACQAVSPRSSLRSAFARFNSGSGIMPVFPR